MLRLAQWVECIHSADNCSSFSVMVNDLVDFGALAGWQEMEQSYWLLSRHGVVATPEGL